ncbi:MAG TPA: hypothetical protein VNF47_02750 [Streptosporangiaceae bacterium]|nr:hypothetical protein [Streptosporangiaceae bacterium]
MMTKSQAAVRTDERAWRYTTVDCERCGAAAAVAKFSMRHTSVQWTSEAVLACAEFAAAVAAGGASALIPTCASMRASIEAAVGGGRVEILPP